MVKNMKLTVLTDNSTYIDRYYLAEPALSFYIEDGNKKILFDTGYSDVFIKNAQKMQINLQDLDYIVFSHGHNDHTGGLEFLGENKAEIIAHPNCFDKKFHLGFEVGSVLKKEDITDKYRCRFTKQPFYITDNLLFLGEIPRRFQFENISVGTTIYQGKEIDDYVKDDTALVYKGEDGLFIITGCSHSGICNIAEYAKELCRDSRINGIIGGFHLFSEDERLEKTVDYLAKNKIKTLYPCHCVSLKAKHLMMNKLNAEETAVSLELNIQ